MNPKPRAPPNGSSYRPRAPPKTPPKKRSNKTPDFSLPAPTNSSKYHSRAQTFATNKTNNNGNAPKTSKKKQKKATFEHTPSKSSFQGNSNNSNNLTDIETTRSDMRDILWQNAELLESDPNYRKKVWRYMSKVFYGNNENKARYNYELYKNRKLPSKFSNNAPRVSVKVPAMNSIENDCDNSSSESSPYNRLTEVVYSEYLDLLLDREETYVDLLINNNPSQMILIDSLKQKMRSILTAYCCANNNRFGVYGAVQLCAVILTTFNMDSFDSDSDCADTFYILMILTEIMKKYYVREEQLMKDEALLLIDVLCVNEDKLVEKLNELEIDVIDLTVFVTCWIRCLFVNYFEIEFVQRVIDLVLLEGPSVLITIVYGILQFIKNDILQSHDHRDVFDKLSGNKLKKFLKQHEFIYRVIQKAQLLFTEENYKYVITYREKKSWIKLLGLPGQKHFRLSKGVGDKLKVKKAYTHWRRESRKQINSVFYTKNEFEDSDSDLENGNGPNGNGNGDISEKHKIYEYERKLQEAQSEILRLKEPLIIHEEEQHTNVSLLTPHTPLHNTLHTQHAKTTTLSEILYTSSFGDTVYKEPINDSFDETSMMIASTVREIECRTEVFMHSWKLGLNSLNDASISMQGYLCKMTSSKWNSRRATLDKIQRRWFVLRGNFITYYKTHLHSAPKSDKCCKILNYKVNPVQHPKSKYAFELISTPQRIFQKLHKKHDDNQTVMYERKKFVLMPDNDIAQDKQKAIRDKWVKSLRLATKGAILWDVLLNYNFPVTQMSGTMDNSSKDSLHSNVGSHTNSNEFLQKKHSHGHHSNEFIKKFGNEK